MAHGADRQSHDDSPRSRLCLISISVRYSPDPAEYARVDVHAACCEGVIRPTVWGVARFWGVKPHYATRKRLDGDAEHFEVVNGEARALLRRKLTPENEEFLLAHGLGHYALFRREIVPEGAEIWGRKVVEGWIDEYASEVLTIVRRVPVQVPIEW